MSSFKEKLAGMQGTWEEGKGALGLPEATYTFVLQNCELRESKKGNLMVLREHLVLVGDMEGEVQTDFMSLNNKTGMFYLNQWITLMGFEAPDDLADLEEVLEEVSNASPVYTADVVKSGDFVNVRCQELLQESYSPEDGEEVNPPKKEKEKKKGTTPKKPRKSTKVVEEETDAVDKNGFEVGDLVHWEDADSEITGNITLYDDKENVYNVKTAEGEIWEFAPEELTKLDDDGTEEEQEEVEETEDAELTTLLEFCSANDIELPEGADLASVVSTLNEYEWEENKLAEHEVDLLKQYKVAVKKSPKKRKPAKKKKAKRSKAKK